MRARTTVPWLGRRSRANYELIRRKIVSLDGDHEHRAGAIRDRAHINIIRLYTGGSVAPVTGRIELQRH